MEDILHKTINCKICSGKHKYSIAVVRSMVMKCLTMIDSGNPTQPRKFTRFFTCPKTNEDFQATIILNEASASVIDDITVMGVADGI